ncbi:hypothetical protein [Brachybacterium sp. 107]|uniref:hypothetical protein n=1 Tax=Brachybacterium sp. 107 TaxID=3457736 RepID=UPI004034CE9C
MARITKGWFGQYHLVDVEKDLEKAARNRQFRQDMAATSNSFQSGMESSARTGALAGLLVTAVAGIVAVLGIRKLFTVPKARYVVFSAAIFLIIALEGSDLFGFVAACATTAAFVVWYVKPRWTALRHVEHLPKHFFNPRPWGLGMALLLTPLFALFVAAIARPLGTALVNVGNTGIYEYNVSVILVAIVAYPVGFALALLSTRVYTSSILPIRLRRQQGAASSAKER